MPDELSVRNQGRESKGQRTQQVPREMETSSVDSETGSQLVAPSPGSSQGHTSKPCLEGLLPHLTRLACFHRMTPHWTD